MKVIILILASIVASVAADCEGLSPTLCSELESAAQSLSNAIETSNDAIAEAVTEAAQKTAALYKASTDLLKSTIPVSKAKSADVIVALETRLAQRLREAEAAQKQVLLDASDAFQEASDGVRHVLEEAVLSARESDSEAAAAVAFAIGGESLKVLKEKLEKALKSAHGKLKEIAQKAIEKINAGIVKLEGFLVKVLGEAGLKKVTEFLQAQVMRLLKKLEESLAKQVESKTEVSFDLAVKDTETFIIGLEAENSIAKRSFWDKIKNAVSRISGIVRDAAMKAIEKHKPIIMQKLKELGQAIINLGKDIIIEIVNGVVKASVAVL